MWPIFTPANEWFIQSSVLAGIAIVEIGDLEATRKNRICITNSLILFF